MGASSDFTVPTGEKIALREIPGTLDGIPADENRAVHVVELLLDQAVLHRASDIHLEAKRTGLLVKFRIDGTLLVVAEIESDLTSLVLTRLKVLAHMVIYQRDTPQDGRLEFRSGEATHQLRVAFMPTLHGEKAVVRLSETVERPLDLVELGMGDGALRRTRRLIAARQGVILLTGPSSSGKTTTMYAMLLAIHRDAGESINIATLEDPVEMDLGCISQTPIPAGGDMSYSDGLKSLLRQDPDVLMIGEIRDVETAKIVVQAGLTGHLAISTIHCGRASMVYARLLNMEIEPFLVASSVQAAIAQRLVRRLCPKCRCAVEVDGRSRERLGLAPDARVFDPGGCDRCDGTGYRGRTGIFELLESDDALQDLVVRKAPAREVAEYAAGRLPSDLNREAMRKVEEGVTSIAEACRAVGGEIAAPVEEAE